MGNLLRALALRAFVPGLLLLSLAHAVVPPTPVNLIGGIATLCGLLSDLLPPICLLLVFSAGVVYAAGQVGGAETRAKAQGYATAMVIGAFIGIVLSIILPAFLRAIYGSDLTCAIAILG